MRPLGKTKIEWSPKFAYGIGLITSDGSLSKDGRHIYFTSKDLILVEIFKNCFELKNKIGKKCRGGETEKKYFVVQFGDRIFYEFLCGIGLHPNKSKTLQALAIPSEFFIDFFRGCFDGDGCITTYMHPESKNLQVRLKIASASPLFLKWMLNTSRKVFSISGGYIDRISRAYQLTFATKDTLSICSQIYYHKTEYHLPRKHEKYLKLLGRVA